MSARSILVVSGPERVSFLQGILTQDVSKLAEEKIQFAALLSPQGKILNDMFLIAHTETILLDTAAEFAEALHKRLTMYKLRTKVEIADDPMIRSSGDPLILADPRHRDLPTRTYTRHDNKLCVHTDHRMIGSSDHLFPELGHDFTPDTITALDAGYDLLNAISFTKGCYVGQEVTARMHYKHIARKGWYTLSHPQLAPRLTLLRFDAVGSASALVTIEGITYHATLVDWMTPRYNQYLQTSSTQE